MEEIDSVLKEKSFSDLEDMYSYEQDINQEIDINITKRFVKEFNKDKSYIEDGLEVVEAFNTIIFTTLMGNNEKKKEYLLALLKKYNYNYNSEIYTLFQIADLYYAGYMADEEVEKYKYLLTTLKDLVITPYSLYTVNNFGKVYLPRATEILDIPEVPMEKRENNCHSNTLDVLKHFPNLYGAYVNMPKCFYKYFSHSIVLDIDHNLVLDMTSDIAVPLTFFQKYVSKFEFVLKGSELVDICARVKDKYDYDINMAYLNTIRTLKK